MREKRYSDFELHLFTEEPESKFQHTCRNFEDAYRIMTKAFKVRAEIYNATIYSRGERYFGIFYRSPLERRPVLIQWPWFLSEVQASRLRYGEDGKVLGLPPKLDLDLGSPFVRSKRGG